MDKFGPSITGNDMDEQETTVQTDLDEPPSEMSDISSTIDDQDESDEAVLAVSYLNLETVRK